MDLLLWGASLASTILTVDLLCEYIKITDMGYGLTREDVQRLACTIVNKTGRKHPFRDRKAGRLH